jgi:hypothetical protein
MGVCVAPPTSAGESEQSVAEGERVSCGHQFSTGIVSHCFDQPSDFSHYDGQTRTHGDLERTGRGRAAVGENHGIGPLVIPGQFSVGNIPVDSFDEICVRAPGDCLLGSAPAFPRFADNRQAKITGLLTTKQTERIDKIFHTLEWSNYTKVQKFHWHAVMRVK